MSQIHESVALGNTTILHLRQLLAKLRSGQKVQPIEIEVVLARSLTDLAGLIDYVTVLQSPPNEKDHIA